MPCLQVGYDHYHTYCYYSVQYNYWLSLQVSELKARLDMVEPAKHPVFNTTEANRLQSLLQGVYGERGRLRKGMADLDASERDTLLRIYRKVCGSRGSSFVVRVFPSMALHHSTYFQRNRVSIY